MDNFVPAPFYAAVEATMAALEAAGCQSAAEFLLTFSTKAAAQSSDHEAGDAPSTFPFKVIMLVGSSDIHLSTEITGVSAKEGLRVGNEKFEDLQWGVEALLFIIPQDDQDDQDDLQWGVEALPQDDQDDLQWGVEALPRNDLERTLHVLACIPPFECLAFLHLEFDQSHHQYSLYRALISSANFSQLYVYHCFFPTLPKIELFPSSSSLLRSLVIITKPLTSIACLLESLVLPSLTSLTSLVILGAYFLGQEIRQLFASLEESPDLITLSLRGCYGFSWPSIAFSWPSIAVLDSLRRNALIHNVDLRDTPLEGDSAIEAQLRKNAENADRLKKLGSQGKERVKPSTVRLYLCGLPLSGKTTLCRSLAKSNKASLYSFLSNRYTTIRLSDRTRGIEVSTLENQQAQQRISIWDMAGQIEYHSFHDSMLPDFSDRAIPPLFLYVWNPFQMDAGPSFQFKSPDQFKADFNYWLKFIASKTLKSELFKPKVIVAITRADLGHPHIMNSPNIKSHLGSSFNALRNKFKEYISMDMEEGFFYVDARDSRMVFELRSYLFNCVNMILSKAPQDFKVCDTARQVFTSLIHSKKIPPLITKAAFSRLCRRHLGIESLEREAVALSLSSSGDIIYFSSLELVVVDIRWFCQRIMGDLLHFNMKSANLLHSKGFFQVKFLQNLLEKEMNLNIHKFLWTRGASTSRKSLKVSGDQLLQLLMGLRLACQEDYGQKDSKIFIPASLCGKGRDKIVPSTFCQFAQSCNSYIGRRWAVKDSNHTFLTPGIFPLLQVTFHKNLSEKKIRVVLNQDVMAFFFEGASVFVEFCRLEGKDNFIDVLVGSHHTLNEGLQWIQENVTIQMEKVFADSRGIPGADLVQLVIQPASVQALMEAKERQAICVEELQRKMTEHVQKKGATDGLKNVRYTWQENVPVKHDLVMDLLGEVEVSKVVEAYRGSLGEAARDHVLDVVVEEGRIHPRPKPTFGSSQSQIQREAIYDKLCDVQDDVKRDMKRLADQVEGLRNIVLPKFQQMFTFVQEGEAGRLPRMFVVTHELGGGVRKLLSKVVPGLRNLRLEIICECRESAHRVDGQRGLSITTLEDGLLKRGLPYINWFLKAAHQATKIGAHVALGAGDVVPDFTRFVASIIDTAEFQPVHSFSRMPDDWNSSSRNMDFGKCQQWLFDVLSRHNCTTGHQIHAQFGLHRIRYPDYGVAWVCDQHYSQGKPFPA